MKFVPRIVGLLFGALWLTVIATGLFGCSSVPNERLAFAPTPPSEPAWREARAIPTATSIAAISDTTTRPLTPIAPTPKSDDSPGARVRVEPTAIRPTLTPVLAKPMPDPGWETTAPSLPNVAAVPPRPFSASDLYLHLPPQANQQQPLRVLLVLHGMGARGESFAKALGQETDRNNWLIVAPNLPYRDYMEPQQLMEDDLKITKMLADTLDALPARLNVKLYQRVLVYGFSRGGQLAHRFAILYPDRVEGVVTMGAGSYTLPAETRHTDKGAQVLPFPFGVGDLKDYLGRSLDWSRFKRISFWIAVGEKDNRTNEVPRAFDSYLGNNRVERARSFEQALRAAGVDARLVIFPNAGHEVTGEMRKDATQFLRECELANRSDD